MNIKFTLITLTYSFVYFNLYSQVVSSEKYMQIYGYVMMDAGYNAGQIHPLWYDVVRSTQLSSYEDQYGPDGNLYMSVRQSQFGVKGYTPTKYGVLKTHFEFGLFGTGADAGQTTFRLRYAYGELGKWGFGQTLSPFMDIDVAPNSLEGWGPSGMVFFRNIQARYMPIQGETRMTIALERPGASADQGPYGEWISEFGDVKVNLQFPDLSAEYHMEKKWGYVELAGILRQIKWKDMDKTAPDLSGDLIGYGINLSTNIKLGDNNVFRGQIVYGAGIQNYMNDATTDVGIESPDSIISPDEAKALPIIGVVAFIDHKWNDRFSTSLGYSTIIINNADVSGDTFKKGQYGLVNLLYTPVENFMTGVEVQWGSRENEKEVNNYDGTSIVRIQFSFKYNFSSTIK